MQILTFRNIHTEKEMGLPMQQILNCAWNVALFQWYKILSVVILTFYPVQKFGTTFVTILRDGKK